MDDLEIRELFDRGERFVSLLMDKMMAHQLQILQLIPEDSRVDFLLDIEKRNATAFREFIEMSAKLFLLTQNGDVSKLFPENKTEKSMLNEPDGLDDE